MRVRLVLPFAALAVALALAGCGASSEADSGSGADPASLVPADAPLYLEADLAPDPQAAADLDRLVRRVFGVESLGDYIVSEIEKGEGEIDFGRDIEPWLGESFGLFLTSSLGDDFEDGGFMLAATDVAAAEEFVAGVPTDSGEPAEEASYEGVDYRVDPTEGEAIGVIGDFFVFAESEPIFKRMVDASGGESLADEETFESAASSAPVGGIADVFVDIGRVIEEEDEEVDAETELGLALLGLESETATAFATVFPGSDQLEIDLRSDLFGEIPLGGDAAEALAEMPASSVLALSTSQLGERLGAAADHLDAEGGEGVPPHQMKRAYEDQFGIDIDQVLAAAGNAAAFGEGVSEESLRGALTIEMESEADAADTVASVGDVLRLTGTEGYRELGGSEPGFFVHDPEELGSEPLVVVAAGRKIVVSYGLAALNTALEAGNGPTIGDSPQFEQAVASLRQTPIGLFADGPRAVRLAASLLADNDDFQEALPYLRKIEYLAAGAEPAGDLSAAKLIVGFGE